MPSIRGIFAAADRPGVQSPAAAPGREGGFTLIELMLSLVLTSLLFSAMLMVFQTQTRVNTVESDVVEMQQNARMGMNALSLDIRQAGYFTDQFNRQPIWVDAAPYQLIFNANLSDQFVAMNKDSAVPLHDGTMYHPGDFTAAPQEENLPGFLDRYLNESETIRLTLDRTYDGQVTAADRQTGTPNPNVYTLTKEINGNPPAILAYNVRGPDDYPDGTHPEPVFQYWGTFAAEDSLSLWGDTNGNGRLDQAEIGALTAVDLANLPEIRQVDVSIQVETSRPDRRFEGPGSTASEPYHYRSYVLRGRIRARNVGINPLGLVLCGQPPGSPRDPAGYDTPNDRGGSITIQWRSSDDEGSGEGDVQFYKLYRRLEMGEWGPVGQFQATGVDTTYYFEDDGDLDNFDAPVDGQPYYYYISAWDCAPQESEPSAIIGPIISLANGPAPPTIVDAWDTECDAGQDITVLFTKSAQDDGTPSGVDKYLIYRGEVADSSTVSKVQVDTLAATGSATYTYHDNDPNLAGVPPDDDKDYWYIIRAVQGNVASENSNEFGPVRASGGLSAPHITAVSDRPGDSGDALIVDWRRSMSELCTPAPSTYRVLRRIQGTTTWTTVVDLPVAFMPTYTHTDDNGGSGLITGTVYEYQVEVRTTGTAKGSNIVSGIPLENPPVGAPTNLDASDIPCESDGDIFIRWARSPDDGAGNFKVDEYWLYRKLDGGSYSLIQTFPATGALLYTWIDSDSSNVASPPVVGNTYWYKVTAYDTDTSSESPPSNEDDVMSDGSPGAPTVTAAYDIMGSGSRAIRVEFTASVDDGGCSDSVTQYRIYRTTTPGVYGTPVATITASDQAAYTWVDAMSGSPPSAAPPLDGTAYWYIVRAFDAVNIVESQPSNEFGPVEPWGSNCDCCAVFSDDMESGDIGWTHDSSPSNRDDWEIGAPNGKSFDPSMAHSGANVWGTDLGAGALDGQYRSNSLSWLISPTIDLSAFSDGFITLQYYRWLSVETAQKDKATVRVNTGDGWEVVWQNTQNDNTVDTSWRLQLIDLSQWVIGEPNVQIGWFLETNQSTQFGGWNIDDVDLCYSAPGPCDYFLYVGDSIAENQGNNLFFEITNGALTDIEMQGMIINWSAEGSRLKRIATQAGGPGVVWEASTSQLPIVTAIFDEVVPFSAGETIKFKFEYQPGQMRGSALTMRFITNCGETNDIVIMVPE